jgi:hypothetical protein
MEKFAVLNRKDNAVIDGQTLFTMQLQFIFLTHSTSSFVFPNIHYSQEGVLAAGHSHKDRK